MNQSSKRAFSYSRRHFVQGLGAASLPVSLWSSAAWGQVPGGRSQPTLTGPRIDLQIAPLPFNVTGRPRIATAVNGSLPGPILRLTEGDAVTIRVRNALPVSTSIHWHGLRLPNPMDGVPGLTFAGIAPGETFTYRFPIRQGGTYWYHSHTGLQEQTGLSGPLILVPRDPEPYHYDRECVVMLADWIDADPMTIVSNLKQESDYYDYHRLTFPQFIADARRHGLGPTLKDRLMWDRMRMSPTDISDVTGATYTFLLNGTSPAANWTGLFKPGERIRLRFINGSSMTTFDVRIPGLPLTVVAADGSDVEPVTVGEFRIGVGETYDVIVAPPRDAAYTLFAQAEDRSGYARGTLAPRTGMAAAIPPMDPWPLRTTVDMGMAMGHEAMPGMSMADMPGMDMGKPTADPADTQANNADGIDPAKLRGAPFVDNVTAAPHDRLSEPGDGLENNGRRVLVYTDLRALHPDPDTRAPTRDIVFHLTGNMQRFVWGFDGEKFTQSAPIRIKLGERVRFILINDTMMEHPMHLHGFLFSLENGHAGRHPLKHTVNVKPSGLVRFHFTADTPGYWAFHCHLLYHMEAGMFRTVLIA
ncbi:MAG TPA: copper resistance system multicopper oxidase [Steroidobacteraceae bacterium]|nr:copper resistance system multicopper oxidase [Steroidobacteraceae bacterium]